MAPLTWLRRQFDMTGEAPTKPLSPSVMSVHSTPDHIKILAAIGIVMGLVALAALISIAFYYYKKHLNNLRDAIHQAQLQNQLQPAHLRIDSWLSQVGHELGDLRGQNGRVGSGANADIASAVRRPSLDHDFQFPTATHAASSTGNGTSTTHLSANLEPFFYPEPTVNSSTRIASTVTRPSIDREHFFSPNTTSIFSAQATVTHASPDYYEQDSTLASPSTGTNMQRVDTITEIDVTDAQTHVGSTLAAASWATTPVFGISMQQGSSASGNGHVRQKAVPQFPLTAEAELEDDITNVNPIKLWSPVAPGATSDVILRERGIIGYEEISYTLREKNRSEALAQLEGRALP